MSAVLLSRSELAGINALHLQCALCGHFSKSHAHMLTHTAGAHPRHLDEVAVGRLGNIIVYQSTAKLFHCYDCFFTTKEFHRLYEHIITLHCMGRGKEETGGEGRGKEETGGEGRGKEETGGEEGGKGETGGEGRGKEETGGEGRGKEETGGEEGGKEEIGGEGRGKEETGGEGGGKEETGGEEGGKGETGGEEGGKEETGGEEGGKGETGGEGGGKGETGGEGGGKEETGGEEGGKGETGGEEGRGKEETGGEGGEREGGVRSKEGEGSRDKPEAKGGEGERGGKERSLKRKRSSDEEEEEEGGNEEENEEDDAQQTKKYSNSEGSTLVEEKPVLCFDGNGYRCMICGWWHKLKALSITHVMRKHDIPKAIAVRSMHLSLTSVRQYLNVSNNHDGIGRDDDKQATQHTNNPATNNPATNAPISSSDLLREEIEATAKVVRYVANRFVCQICGWKTKLKGFAISHVVRTHEVEKPYSCKDCDKAFFLPSHLQQHVSSQHRPGLYGCPFCCFRSDSLGGFRRHCNRCNTREEGDEQEEEEGSDGEEGLQ